MSALRTLAQVFAPLEAETAAGGRTVGWEPVGDLWLAVASVRRTGDGGNETPPGVRERAVAETRSDPRLTAGLRVDIRGAAWRLTAVEPDAPWPCRMILTLERDLP